MQPSAVQKDDSTVNFIVFESFSDSVLHDWKWCIAVGRSGAVAVWGLPLMGLIPVVATPGVLVVVACCTLQA